MAVLKKNNLWFDDLELEEACYLLENWTGDE
jgi:hypothetical protein